MRRRVRICVVIAVLAMAAPAASLIRDGGPSGTKSFFLDGRTFVVEDPAGGDIPLVRRRLEAMGIDASLLPGGNDPSHPFLAGTVRQVGDARTVPRSPLPAAFRAEHQLQLDTETGAVSIAFGKSGASGSASRSLLTAAGYEWRAMNFDTGPIALATITTGRETKVVLLEEETGEFLYIERKSEQGP